MGRAWREPMTIGTLRRTLSSTTREKAIIKWSLICESAIFCSTSILTTKGQLEAPVNKLIALYNKSNKLVVMLT